MIPDDELPTLWEIEAAVIQSRLEYFQGNRTHTARPLGISIRTLRNQINALNLPKKPAPVPGREISQDADRAMDGPLSTSEAVSVR